MVVPPGESLSTFSKLFSPFESSVWYVIYSLMLIVLIVISLLKCQSKEIQDFVFGRDNRTPFMNVINVVVGSPVPKLPRRNFARWNLTMFIILWLVIRSLYQVVIYKNFQSTERNVPVQTIEESLRLGFVYYMIAPTQENIKYLPEVYDRKIVVSRHESVRIMMKFNDPTLKAAFLGKHLGFLFYCF